MDTASLEIAYHVLVMDDLMKHVERRTVSLECTLNGLYGHLNASAESPRLGKYDFLNGHRTNFKSEVLPSCCQPADLRLRVAIQSGKNPFRGHARAIQPDVGPIRLSLQKPGHFGAERSR